MATNPNDIQLNEAEKQRLATVADRHGRPWPEVFHDALTQYVGGSGEGEVDLMAEYRELFPDGDVGQKPISLERMRQLLSQVSESLATDIIADREDRL
jgi:hypothetical protein